MQVTRQPLLAADVRDADMILDIGPKAAASISERIGGAATIYGTDRWVCSRKNHLPAAQKPWRRPLQPAPVFHWRVEATLWRRLSNGVSEGISYISTGGGAFLEYVEEKFYPPLRRLMLAPTIRCGKAETDTRRALMAPISLRQLLDHAAEHGYGVPAFNVNNLEQTRAIMEAADQTDSPVIMQASAGAETLGHPSCERLWKRR